MIFALITTIAMQEVPKEYAAVLAAISKKAEEAKLPPICSLEQAFYGELKTAKGTSVWISQSITITESPGKTNRLVHRKMIPTKNRPKRNEELTGQNGIYKFVLQRDSSDDSWKLASCAKYVPDTQSTPLQDVVRDMPWTLQGEAFSLVKPEKNYDATRTEIKLNDNDKLMMQFSLRSNTQANRFPIDSCEVVCSKPDLKVANYTIAKKLNDGERTISGEKQYDDAGLLLSERKLTKFKNNTDTSTEEITFKYGTVKPTEEVFKLPYYGIPEPTFDGTDSSAIFSKLPWFKYVIVLGFAILLIVSVLALSLRNRPIEVTSQVRDFPDVTPGGNPL